MGESILGKMISLTMDKQWILCTRNSGGFTINVCSNIRRCTRQCWSKMVTVWLFILVFISPTTAICIEDGQQHENGSTWSPAPCTTCRCQTPLVVCENITCLDPGCQFSQGEVLQIAPGTCCPSCVQPLKNCHHNSTSYKHETTWSPSPCETCTCYDGVVTCTAVTCHDVTNCQGQGQTVQTPQGHCCPTCVNTGRQCRYHGDVYTSGTSWRPSPCVRCTCDDADVSCFTLTCPRLNCAPGHRVLTLPGECCPSCLPPPCQYAGRIYRADSMWRADRCTVCACHNQHVTCHRKTCPTPPCPQGKVPVWKKNKCCPVCIDEGSSCRDKNTSRYHTELWHRSPCETCVCRDSHVICTQLTCPPLNCTQEEVKETPDGACCPVCLEKKTCSHHNSVIQRGTWWRPSPCDLCECDHHGNTICYSRSCSYSHCSPGGLQPLTPNSQCCGECPSVDCAAGCATCVSSNSSVCMSCSDPRRHLQDGACTTNCSPGFFLHHSRGHCLKCASQCATCGGETNHHCLTCPGGALWQRGRCVKSCSQGHVLHKGICQECSEGCRRCESTERCRRCHHEYTLTQGYCVPKCTTVGQWDQKSNRCRANKERPRLQIRGHLQGSTGKSISLTNKLIHVVDSDSLTRHMVYHVTAQPANGELVLVRTGIDVVLHTGDSFTQNQLKTGSLYYRYSRDKPLQDHFTIKADDGTLQSSVEMVNIVLKSTVPPAVVQKQPLIVEQGGKSQISPTDHLTITDEDTPGTVTVAVIHKPEHGHIVRGAEPGSVAAFSLHDLQQSHLVYVQDISLSSLPTYDQVSLQVSDGNNVITILLDVIIVQQGRKSPILITNTPLQVDEGHEVVVSPSQLLAINPVGGATSIIYTVTLPSGSHQNQGSFFMIVNLPAEGVASGWHRHGKNKMAAEMTRFRQSDIDQGHIVFKASDDSKKEIIFDIVVCDISRPPHCSTSHNFLVRVTRPQRDSLFDSTLVFVPDENSKLGTTVYSNKVTPLMADDFGTHILDAHPDDIEYRITSALSTGQGIIEHAQNPRVPIRAFTQSDLNKKNVLYRPPDEGLEGEKPIEVSFKFIVLEQRTDEELPEQTFHIQVLPVTSSPPVAIDSSPVLKVKQGGTVPIGVEVIQVKDTDTALHNLNVIVVKVPKSGQYLKLTEESRVILREGDQFSFGEIQSGLLFYEHDGSSSEKDGFDISVSDGQNSVRVNVRLDISSVDRSAPTQHPLTSMSLSLPEGTTKEITRNNLAFTDTDSNDNELVIVLVTDPYHGRMLLGDSQQTDRQISRGASLTQWDIDNGKLKYQAEEEIGPDTRVDSVYFNVSDVTGNMLAAQLFTVTTTPINNQPPQLKLGSALQVDEGGRVPLTTADLEISDLDTHPINLKVIFDKPPTHGVFQNVRPAFGSEDLGDETVEWFTADDIVQGHIHYVQIHHHGNEPRSDQTLLHVTDGNNSSPVGVLKFTIMPINDEAPVLIAQTLQCGESDSVLLTVSALNISDTDSALSTLTMTVDIEPTQGSLRKRSNPKEAPSTGTKLKPGATFTYQDLLGESIFYTHEAPTEGDALDTFSIRVTDGMLSSVSTVTVQITARDDETPRVNVNRGLRVPPGSITTLTPLDLQATDIDSDNLALTFTITRGPTKGKWFLTLPSPGLNNNLQPDSQLVQEGKTRPIHFLQDQSSEARQRTNLHIAKKHQVYSRDSDSKQDRTVRFTDQRTIADEPLSLLEAEAAAQGEWTEPRQEALPEWAGPVESGGVANGGLTPGVEVDLSNNQVEISATGVVNGFSQLDINEGRVSFAHSPEEPAGMSITDFTVTDPEGNTLLDQTFIIDIVDDRGPPKVTTNKELEVTEGQEALLTTDHLSAIDSELESGKLRYYIVEPPKHGYLATVLNREMPIAEFTQEDLAGSHVIYIHRSEVESLTDRFTFAVSDGPNQVIRTFFVRIAHVNNKLPKVINRGLRLQEGQTMDISEFDLQIIDEDTEELDLEIIVTRQPLHGHLTVRRRGDVPASSATFSMTDIYEGLVSYTHDGSETSRDSFMFSVSDGSNLNFLVDGQGETPTNQDQEFVITIVGVDDGSPILRTNTGLQFLSYRDDKATNNISNKELYSDDEDSGPSELMYSITTQPAEGYIENTGQPGLPVSSFTQDDVNQGRISYVMTGNASSLHDQLTFDLEDRKPNRLLGNVFHITWSLIEFEHAQYNVTEKAGDLRIPVKRRGFTKQYSVVTCRSIADSATSDKASVRLEKNDFKAINYQIQFEGYEDTKECRIRINEDGVFEGRETFYVELTHPEFSLLGRSTRATVVIRDHLDEPVIQFDLQGDLDVTEDAGIISVPLIRHGDVSNMASVACLTRPLTARGSTGRHLVSGSDYQTREPADGLESRVMFAAGSAHASCDVRIIDDSEYEESEAFELLLTDPSMMTRIGPHNIITINIIGPNDESDIHFSQDTYYIDETSASVDLPVRRTGPDLRSPATVWCTTQASSEASSAQPGEDFIPTRQQLTFQPGQQQQLCSISVVQDIADPRLEGNETLYILLSSAAGARLGEPHVASVIIDDMEEDVSTMQFAASSFTFSEDARFAEIPVTRSGDITYETSVICYTRQKVARVSVDYIERPWTDASRMTFPPNVKTVNCTVELVEDGLYEGSEQLTLHLADPLGWEQCGARVGPVDKTTLTITDPLDVPRVEFESASYMTSEPVSDDVTSHVTVAIVRHGDVEPTVTVRYGSRDGSATSGVDYTARSDVITFLPGVSRVTFDLEILHNQEAEWQETFSVVLGPQDPTNAKFGDVIVTKVTIMDSDVTAGTVFPAPPIVVSLLDYDDVGLADRKAPSAGYPLVCVTACNTKHPSFTVTNQLCTDSRINQSLTIYHWEVSMPTTLPTNHNHPPTYTNFQRITDRLPFSDCDSAILDSVYFRPRFSVRCIAVPVTNDGQSQGLAIGSEAVTIANENGVCGGHVSGVAEGLHGESFMASIEYVSPEDDFNPNTVHVSVRIPHQDGLLPLMSTYPLHNLQFLLTAPSYQHQHACSNFVVPPPRHNIGVEPVYQQPYFLYMRNQPSSISPGYDLPYQLDEHLRGVGSVDLYKHLNLRTCQWEFEGFLHLSDLVDLCGGRVISDFEALDKALSHLTVHLPLHVSYVYSAGCGDWTSIDHRTELELSILYDTMAWKAGLGAGIRVNEDALTGDLQITKISTNPQGNLVIDFKTKANFRGCFVTEHVARPGWQSQVLPPTGLPLTFTMEEVWSQPTFDAPIQHWRAWSDLNLRDFSGDYRIELIPCTVRAEQSYPQVPDVHTRGQNGVMTVCTPHQPQRFGVALTYQQTLRPKPATYALATDFHVTSHVSEFLLPPSEGHLQQLAGFDGVFSKGDKLYGRVLWSPDQDLQDAYNLQIEKVFVCTGSNGFVPTYDPDGSLYGAGPQYGCLHPTANLKHRYLVLDRGDPQYVVRQVQGLPFNAIFATDDVQFSPMWMMPGVDGFVLNVDPLYKVNSGHVWYIQVLYVIKAAGHRGRHRRAIKNGAHESANQESPFTSTNQGPYTSSIIGNQETALPRNKRQTQQTYGTDVENKHGTNIMLLRLKQDDTQNGDTETNENLGGNSLSVSDSSSRTSTSTVLIIGILSAIIVVLLLTVILLLTYWKRTKHKSAGNSSLSQQNQNTTNVQVGLQVTVNADRTSQSICGVTTLPIPASKAEQETKDNLCSDVRTLQKETVIS